MSTAIQNPASGADVSADIVDGGRGPVILARHLNFAFGEGELSKQILFDLNFEIAAGEIAFLTGPSGSGKTTLLTLIGALRQVKSGELSVLGQQLLLASTETQVQVRRQIGFIFQQHNLLPFLTARQNVELMFQLHEQYTTREASERTAHLLERVGLADRMDYHPARLSGGQKQRVAVARALVTEPKLVLADEPTASLDGQTGREVVELLQELSRSRGCPILMVTHDSRVLEFADRVIAFEDGRILESGRE